MIKFLIKNPIISHGVSAFYQTLIMLIVYLGLKHMDWDNPEILAFVGVCIFYYGREAGQREHDLKNLYKVDPVTAAFGSDYAFKWSESNWLEWFGAIVGSFIMTAILIILAVYVFPMV